jgi:hypothetical protein
MPTLPWRLQDILRPIDDRVGDDHVSDDRVPASVMAAAVTLTGRGPVGQTDGYH